MRGKRTKLFELDFAKRNGFNFVHNKVRFDGFYYSIY